MGKGANLEEAGLFFFFFFLFFSFPYLVLAALPTSLNLRMAAAVGLDVTPGITDAGGGTGRVTAGLQSSPRRPESVCGQRAALGIHNCSSSSEQGPLVPALALRALSWGLS